MRIPEGRSGKSTVLSARKTDDFVIEDVENKHDGFFSLNIYPVSHRRTYGEVGEMTPVRKFEVFERGDAVGVLLYDRKNGKVIVVRQFRLPTVDLAPMDHPDDRESRPEDEPAPRNGWIIEAVAGMVGPIKDAAGNIIGTETPEETAIRETREETGYQIENPELIATFFSSPGGTTERIFLFFALVSDDSPTGGKPRAYGTSTEDIEVLKLPVATFSRMVGERKIVDPKLLIAAYYLQARLGLRIETDRHLAPADAPPTLFRWNKRSDIAIGFKTGDILSVRGVDIWLNPENKYMMMARVIDDTLSASIRWGGAEKYTDHRVAVDVIGNALRREVGTRSEVRDDEIIETEPGALRGDKGNNVERLLHLPIGEAKGPQKAREGIEIQPGRIAPTLEAALCHADEANGTRVERWLQWLFSFGARGKLCRSVLVPMIGTGQGGLTTQEVVPNIVKGIADFLEKHGEDTVIDRIYLLVRYERDLADCERELAASHHFTRDDGSASPPKAPGAV
ncbi:MAG: NUDIX domain-containing protein [Pseudorhodoplanes sp.]